MSFMLSCMKRSFRGERVYLLKILVFRWLYLVN